MRSRIILLVTSPRLPAGLLTAAAWDAVRTHPVLAGSENGLVAAVRDAGVEVTLVDDPVPALLRAVTGDPSGGVPSTDTATGAATATGTGSATGGRTVVWLVEPGGDESFTREVGLRLARSPGLADLELCYGSWDPPGARLLDAVAVMDRLASPGGDPWKRAQTHASLAGFLLEECYEAYDAISAGDLAALREELGDVLLQVVLHARLAEELPESQRWSIDDVAGTLVAKMIRRNPHVFADVTAETLEEITDNWEQIKRAEKPRGSVLDGVPLAQPALSLAAKLMQRAGRAGLDVPLPDPDRTLDDEARLGASLLATVARARTAGLDAEAALRRAALAYADLVRQAETTGTD
jgi:XTP/dITP diphosphohydrolase